MFYGTQASDKSFFLPDVLSGVKVVIDPGHGGIDGGASHGEIVEPYITLAMSLKIRKRAEIEGATVVGHALAHTANQMWTILQFEQENEQTYFFEKKS